MKNKINVFILTFCRNLDLFYGTKLIFETLRVGFPNAKITVVDNASLQKVRGEIESLYFFYGENTYLINEAIEEISTCLFPSRSPGLDSHYYDAQIHDPSEIIQSARTVPFFSKKKLVVIKEVHYFKNTQWERFQSYFSNPLKHCCLVLIGKKRSLTEKPL